MRHLHPVNALMPLEILNIAFVLFSGGSDQKVLRFFHFLVFTSTLRE
jgi:hypothetical protein